MEKEKNRFVLTFEDYVKKHSGDSIWKSIDEIAHITGSTESTAFKQVQSFDEFIENSNGEFTTRKLYEENSSFFKKMFDQIKNRID